MILHFLKAEKPFAKHIEVVDGVLVKHPYPMIRNVTSIEEKCVTIVDFFNLLNKHAALGHALLKGRLTRHVDDESRAGLTKADEETQWLVLDIDGLENFYTADQFIKSELPPEFHTVSYVVQESNSAGLSSEPRLNLHIYFMLKGEYTPAKLKSWFKSINTKEDSGLRRGLSLSKNGMTLKYKLDITVNQNDKIIYIAPPSLSGIEDPIKGKRFKLIRKQQDKLVPDLSAVNDARINDNIKLVTDNLRAEQGLKPKRHNTKTIDGVDVLLNVDACELDGEPFEERGFVYLPLGGNKYTYYHTVGNPKIVHNFREEPPVLTKDFLPSYWYSLQKIRLDKKQKQREEVESNDTQFMAFLDTITDQYGWGFVNALKADIRNTASLEKLKIVCDSNGYTLPEQIPAFACLFDPTTTRILDKEARTINLYSQPPLLKNAQLVKNMTPPLQIMRIINHALGNDKETIEHFINWLAAKFKTRKKLRTSWIITGIEGTGKGLLWNQIIKPLIGEQHCVQKNIESFSEDKNKWLQKCLLANLDESALGGRQSKEDLMNKLKNLVTEPMYTLRLMRTDQIELPSYFDFIVTSNDHQPLYITENDRRFNVAPRQEKPALWLRDMDVEAIIEAELPAFADYLFSYKHDMKKANFVLKNKAREILIANNINSVDLFFNALTKGELVYFAEVLRSSPAIRQHADFIDVKRIITHWCSEYMAGDATQYISRDDIKTVYEFMFEQRVAPAKFTRMLSHKGIESVVFKIRGTQSAMRGVSVTWGDKRENIACWLDTATITPLRN